MSNEFKLRFLSSIILLPTFLFIIFQGSYLFYISLIICMLISFKEWLHLTTNKFHRFFGLFFIIISFYSLFKLRNNTYEGFYEFLFVLTICVSTDIGGYVFGKIIKGPKLTKISPNKTYSGTIGSYTLSILSIYIFIQVLSDNIFFESSLQILLITLLISSVSQIGDIVISYFKRLSKKKDTGNIIPGHGGILDRIDGMLFAFPFYYILKIIKIIPIL